MPEERHDERLDGSDDESVEARDAAAEADSTGGQLRGAIVEPPEEELSAGEPPSTEAASFEESAAPDAAADEPASGAPSAEIDAASAPSTGDDREGFFARLGNAFRGFFRGLQGLPIEIPPGEEGTIPVVEANLIQRKLEKRLAKAQARGEDLRAQLEQRKQEIAERDAALKDAQKEMKRARSEAAESEAALRKEAERALESVREKDERIQRLQTEVSGREARLAQRDADLEKQSAEFEDARRAASEKERELASQLSDTQRQLDTRSGELARTEEARAKLEAERDAALARGEELGRELAEARREREAVDQRYGFELAGRDDTISALRNEMNAAAEQAKSGLDEALGELQFTKSALMEKESALQLLLGEVKNQEEEADRERAESAQQQEQLRAEIEDGKRKLAEAQAATEKIRAELVAALPDRAEFNRVSAKAGQLERELAKKAEEADMLRDDLVSLRKLSAETEGRAKSAEEAVGQKAAFQRELQRQSVQLEALREQFTEAQLKVEKLSAALRDFHAPAVSSIQMATVYSESLAASLAMNEGDRGDAQELKQCVEQLRQTMQKLTAKLAELGVPHA